MAVTLRDIARSLGLSHATVSFVLNDRRDVAIPEVTRERVRRAAEEMGYRPNRAARALVKGRTQMLALCVPSLVNPYYAQVFNILHSHCTEHGFETIYCETGHAKGVVRPYEWSVDGVITVDDGLIEAGLSWPKGLPVVSIGAYVDESKDHVRFDLYDAARAAVEHLADIGCKRIAHLAVLALLDDPRGRYAAFRRVAQERGITGELVLSPDARRSTIRKTLVAYLEQSEPPDGLFCYNDWSTVAAIRALADAGVEVPKTTAVVGFDGLDVTQYLVPSVTTIAQPIEEMAGLAFEMLQARLSNPEAPTQRCMLPGALKIRESTTR